MVYVAQEKEEGLYSLNFHNCMNYGPNPSPSAIDMFLKVRRCTIWSWHLSQSNVELTLMTHKLSSLLAPHEDISLKFQMSESQSFTAVDCIYYLFLEIKLESCSLYFIFKSVSKFVSVIPYQINTCVPRLRK